MKFKLLYSWLAACCFALIGSLSVTCLPLFVSAQTGIENSIEPVAFQHHVAEDSAVQLLDVRTGAEFSAGYIRGALHANWNDRTEFARRVSFLDKNRTVYVYCLAGGRSTAAGIWLRKQGFSRVIELKGGLIAWQTAKLELVGTHSERSTFTPDSLNQLISQNKRVLIDFGAAWCPPCRKMEPILKQLETDSSLHFKLIKVDGGKDQELVNAYQVTSLPVFIVIQNGKPIWRRDGIASLAELKEILTQ